MTENKTNLKTSLNAIARTSCPLSNFFPPKMSTFELCSEVKLLFPSA